MKRATLPIALIVSLAAGGAGGAAAEPDPDGGLSAPRVACDLLDVRTVAPRAGKPAAWGGSESGGPRIRRVGGPGGIPGPVGGGLLKVGMGAGRTMLAAMELGPRTVSVPRGRPRWWRSPSTTSTAS